MQGKFVVPLLAACLATMIVVWSVPGRPLAANGGELPALADADDDFLPDAVEWTMLTSSADADTDGDSLSDFIEVMQGSDPRRKGPELPADHQLRLVLTGPSAAGGDTLVWVHAFFLIRESKAPALQMIQSFALWLEVPWLPGLQVPLDAFLPNMVTQQRVTADHDTWLQVSVPLVEPSLFLSIGNCTVRAQATVAGHTISSGMQLVPAQGELLAMVPFQGGDQFVFQSISPLLATDGGDTQPNRVCILDLQEVGAGPGGIHYQVVAADCEDANELECASTCQDSLGWIITVPGGAGQLGGN